MCHNIKIMAQTKSPAMHVETAHVSSNGRVVIPVAYRRALGLKSGGEVIFRLEDDQIQITTMKLNLDRARRRVQKYSRPGKSLADELIAERREAAKHEYE